MTSYALTVLFGLPFVLLGQSLDQQAQGQSNNFWNQRITRCGDTVYIAFKAGDISAFRNGQIRIQAHPLSETDRLNGWEWRGNTALTATATRSWVLSMGGWQEWTAGAGLGTLNASLEKRQGVWRIVPDSYGPFSMIKPFNCSQVPPERFDPSSASVQDAQKEAACKQFMSAGTGGNPDLPWDDQRIQGWIQGLDLKTCRDANGQTPLMKAAGHMYPKADAVRYLLSMGVDVNARDKAGETALSLTQKRLYGGSGSYGNSAEQQRNAEEVIGILRSAMSGADSRSAGAGQKPRMDDYVGQWRNEDTNSSGFTRIEIRRENDTLKIREWSRGGGGEFDWGEADITRVRAPNGSVFQVQWTLRFLVRNQELILTPTGRLRLETQTHFTDQSGRPDRTETAFFIK